MKKVNYWITKEKIPFDVTSMVFNPLDFFFDSCMLKDVKLKCVTGLYICGPRSDNVNVKTSQRLFSNELHVF